METLDLIILPSCPSFSKSAAEYYARNKLFLEEFEPSRQPEFFTATHQLDIITREVSQAAIGAEFHYYIFPKSEPNKIVGMVGLSNIMMGCFCSCFLGYKLDESLQCRGYMTQAIAAVSDLAFETLGLHRLEANVMPRNKASVRVLEKCGFQNEGLAKKYLKINGVWQDHIHMVKLAGGLNESIY